MSEEIRRGVLRLLDEAADSLSSMNIDDAIECSGEYMPFLSQLLRESDIAAARLAAGQFGFRVTVLATDDVLELFRRMQTPPSAG